MIISTQAKDPAQHGAATSESDTLDDDLSESLGTQEHGVVEEEVRALTVSETLHHQRADRVLATLVTEFSRSYLQQLLDDGAVLLAGVPLRKSAQRLNAGDRLVITLRPTPQSQAFKPEVMALQVLHEDAHILVIDKPAGLVVHPAPGHWSGTLLNGLLARDAQCANLPRAGIVHRLDKDTSGLMVVARSRQAMDALVRMIAARDVSREYIAIAHRTWRSAAQRTVDAPIGRDVRNRLRMAVVDLQRSAGKSALTDFSLLSNSELLTPESIGQNAQKSYKNHSEEASEPNERGYCLVHCALHTGRTHQIRVHMAHLGHPLVADAVYGGTAMDERAGDGAGGLLRQALHARRLAFAHPITGLPLQFESALPPDLQAACTALGLRYNDLSAA
jgi:23S rRNA pseudouridine1911/1915/1917 synthase